MVSPQIETVAVTILRFFLPDPVMSLVITVTSH